jgi:hypothetical protein
LPLRRSAQAPRATLTPQDYIETSNSPPLRVRHRHLRQRRRRLADLFTDDGEFSVSQQWGVAGNRKTSAAALITRPAATARAAAKIRRPAGCISHIIVNHVITPTPEGAVGKSYLLAIGVGGDPTKIERQGGYDDVYVKTVMALQIPDSRVSQHPRIGPAWPRGRGPAATAPAPPPAPQQPR